MCLTSPGCSPPIQWYDAVITSHGEEDETYLVTFEGYGNQEVLGLGDLMLPAAPKAEAPARERERSRSVRAMVEVWVRICGSWSSEMEG